MFMFIRDSVISIKRNCVETSHLNWMRVTQIKFKYKLANKNKSNAALRSIALALFGNVEGSMLLAPVVFVVVVVVVVLLQMAKSILRCREMTVSRVQR